MFMVQGLPRGRETELFAQDLLDRLPSTNGSARPSQNQLRERQVQLLWSPEYNVRRRGVASSYGMRLCWGMFRCRPAWQSSHLYFRKQHLSCRIG